jgi:hypothetical protein
MPVTSATLIYRDWILGDATQKEYWMDQIDWVAGHPEDFPDQTLVEVVAEMLGDALTQDIHELAALGSNYEVPALFVRLLEESAGHIDYIALAEQLIAHAAAGLPVG